MAKLTDVRDTPEIANGAKVIAVPVKGGTTIYQGALVALDASGYAIPGKKAESLTGNMASQGTTPRRLTDLIGSLCDLTSGSGDKGTPIIFIQGYFDNFAKEAK